MPLLGTRGAASAQGFGEFAQSGPVNYIEDVFSTYLYKGSGTGTQTITNGIDLSGKGGMVWGKVRTNIDNHYIFDTARGAGNTGINSNTTDAQGDSGVTAFNSNGFSVGTNLDSTSSARTFVTWTFRKQPKFFDVVTYTATGSVQTINHNLGSTPGCIIVKNTSANGSWFVWHTSLGNINGLRLQTTGAATDISGGGTPFIYNVSSTSFTVATGLGLTDSGNSYVVYLFAHNAGGFGTAGTDSVISCGTFTGQTTVTLGWEPQWILRKRTDVSGDWFIHDIMRGFPANNSGSTAETAYLNPNLSSAESTTTNRIFPSATGFTTGSGLAGETYIYIAIRRGPMKTPTSGTSVFQGITRTGNAAVTTVSASITPDATWIMARTPNTWQAAKVFDRLRGNPFVYSNLTDAELTNPTAYVKFDVQNGYTLGQDSGQYDINISGTSYINWNFKRAPGFMDEVCYTGTGSARTVSHNLGVAPEMLIVKRRDTTGAWSVYSQSLGNTKVTFFDTAATINGFSYWNNTSPTSSVFTVNTNADVNASGGIYVAYLFASCPGVSKVGSYTGTGSTQTISCGFAARFVLIKRTDNSVGNTANWWVWDTARGMVAGTDPRLAFNVTNAESNANWVYTDASGFQIVTTDATVNASGGSYIYLAIA